jgi:hypothetical protein
MENITGGSSTDSHWLEMSDQLHAAPALPPEKEPTILIGEVAWTTEPI